MDAGQTAKAIRETQPSKTNGPKRSASVKQIGMKMIPPLTYIIVGLLIVSVGLGAWSYFGSRRQADDGDSISELEGLDFPAPAFDSPKPTKQGSRMPIRTSPAKGVASDRSNSGGKNDQASVNGHDRFSVVWLTGTIEEIDRKDTTDSVRRISGGRGESTNLR